MLQLQVIRGEEVGRTFRADGSAEVTLGRGDDNVLVLDSRHVSTHHAVLISTGDGVALRDLGSTNGSSVLRAEEKLEVSPGEAGQVVLIPGDEIVLGHGDHAVHLAVRLPGDNTRIVSVRHLNQLNEIADQLDRNRRLLREFYDAQREIGSAADLDEVVNVVSMAIFRFIELATHVTVVLRETGEGAERYVPIASRVRSGGGTEPVAISHSVFRKVVDERAAVLAADARTEVGNTASIMAAQILSTMAVPLWDGESIIGVIQVDNRDSKGIFGAQDLDTLALLAQSASQAFVKARLIQQLRRSEERSRNQNVYLKKQEESRRFDGIIGESDAMQAVFTNLRKVVDTRVSVLIQGETGTGKELIASAAHYWSKRSSALFVAQNCAALPENLLESELFGHRKGSFTGATEDKKGLFELAHEGTLFLDELGEMPLGLQAKLLRALQEGEIRPLGASRTKSVDVRVVAATNRDLEVEVAEGRFRQDLFYRLNVFPIALPPLRERGSDILLLAQYFIEKYAAEFGAESQGLTQEAGEALRSYEWPGNVRELENEIQRGLLQSGDADFIAVEHLSPRLHKSAGLLGRVRPPEGSLKDMMAAVEQRLLVEALTAHEGNKTATAKSLNITREGLHKKLKRYGITS